jgi:hypothetical protein
MNRLAVLLSLALVVGASAKEPTDSEARRVAGKIDEWIDAKLAAVKVKANPIADDATFFRRLSYDLTGKIPSVSEVRKFLAEDSPEKREQAIDRLLDTPGYINHATNTWLALLLPEAQADFQKRFLQQDMQRWLRNHFAKNTPYDRMVREIVAMPITPNMYVNFGRGDTSVAAIPSGFYFAKQGKAPEIAATVSRLFLGVRLECAQCHNHPFGKWTRDEFWSQAAFFAGLKGSDAEFFNGPLVESGDRREILIPNTDRSVQARFLDGKAPKWKFKVGARVTLAEWMTAKDNPFFAKAMVNRTWAQLFGIGLVDPVDDLVDDNPASHPELLEGLAREFAEHEYDIKFLMRAITRSKAYQRASVVDPTQVQEMRLFARMPLKGLTAEQLYDSIGEASGSPDRAALSQRIFNFGSARQTFTDKFADQERRTEYHTSIPQALTMMNNDLINTAVDPDRGRTLGAVTSATFMKTPAKIETLYLAALSRKPTPEELTKMQRYIERSGNEKKALSDIFWALLNSTEFKFVH